MLDPALQHRLIQAAIAALGGLLVALLARRRGIRIGSDVAVAMARGVIQIAAVGSVLAIVLRGPEWLAAPVLTGMIIAAAATSARRARGVPGALPVSALALVAGPGATIALMTWFGAIDHALTSLIPVGSMLIANAMNTNGLALNRFRADVVAHVMHVETALALGADTQASVAPYLQSAVEASLIPSIDSLRSLGIVWIPGLMAGMVLTGASPLAAALYQFVVLAMILASSGITALVSTTLIRSRVFSPADQLTLRA
ncbi:MAG TPA: ABC transporter permease [Gemmatimonadaceae bacterium]|nr:ABC transporter permease [Gemmatimonadaceae bacterium]